MACDKLHTSLRELFEDQEFVKGIQILLAPGLEAAVNRAMEQRDAKLAALEQHLTDTKANLAAVQDELQLTKTKVSDMEDRLEAMETYSRRNCLLINGVPELPEESTDDLVLQLARAAGVTLTLDDLDRSHRLGRRSGSVDRPRAIIVKLLSYNKRRQFYEARRELSAHRVGEHPVITRHVLEEVYIAEFLTSKSQRLLYICRQLKKSGRLWAAYTTNGVVKVKTTENQPARVIRDDRALSSLLGPEDIDLLEALSSNSRATPPQGQGQEAATAAARPIDTGSSAGGGRPPARGAAQMGRKQMATTTAARKHSGTGSPFNRGSADPPTTRDRRQPPRGTGQAR